MKEKKNLNRLEKNLGYLPEGRIKIENNKNIGRLIQEVQHQNNLFFRKRNRIQENPQIRTFPRPKELDFPYLKV